jgi:tetratricopeptide (TPR) repeat protein
LVRAEYMRARAICAYLNASYDESSAYYTAAVAVFSTLDNDPNTPFLLSAYRSLGINAVHRGQYNEALAYFDALEQHHDRDDQITTINVNLERAVALHFSKQYDEADKALKTTLAPMYNKTLFELLVVLQPEMLDLFHVYESRVEQYAKAVSIHKDLAAFDPIMNGEHPQQEEMISLSVRHQDTFIDLLKDIINMVGLVHYDEILINARIKNALRPKQPDIAQVEKDYELLANSTLKRPGQHYRAIDQCLQGAQVLIQHSAHCAAYKLFALAATVFSESLRLESSAALTEFRQLLETQDKGIQCDNDDLARAMRTVA